jgi:hypothetical protein
MFDQPHRLVRIIESIKKAVNHGTPIRNEKALAFSTAPQELFKLTRA